MYAKAVKPDGSSIVEGFDMIEIDADGQWDVQTIVTPYGVRIVKSNSATQSEHIVEISFRQMTMSEQWRNV